MPFTSEKPPALSDEWVLGLRPPKNHVDPNRPYAFLVEKERSIAGRVEDVATIFITNRECPFRCVVCDLWKNTTDTRVPVGAVAEQIRWALAQLPPARHIKLYNSGNFFDPNAIPPEDYRDIADLVSGFETVIVESHPSMIGRRCWEFRDLLGGDLHVAIGLETANPDVLARLNKQMSLMDFKHAVFDLTNERVLTRAFIVVRPPFMTEAEGLEWARRSIDFAFDAGVESCALIPSRGGNGALEELAKRGHFAPPSLATLEAALDYGVAVSRGRVFADLWDIGRLEACRKCAHRRIERLGQMSLTQRAEPPIVCEHCGTG